MVLSDSSIGKKIRDARINCGYTQEMVAEKLDITRDLLIQIENGKKSIDIFVLKEFTKLCNADISGFLAEFNTYEDNALVSLFRAEKSFFHSDAIKKQLNKFIEIFQEGTFLKQKLEIYTKPCLPFYDFAAPQNYSEAIEQGVKLAIEERKRLNLGNLPIADIGEIIVNQGIWTTLVKFDDDLSGLYFNHPDINMVIMANQKHSYERRRFSFAHEYCHALVDKESKAKITSRKNSSELIEKRANSFASEFLLPRQGIEEILSQFSKGGKSRRTYSIYDVSSDDAFYGEKRSKASLLKILSHDIALIAHKFQVSYQSTAYKLNDIGYISRKELNKLLDQKKEGINFLKIIKLRNTEKIEDNKNTMESNYLWEIGRLAIEAYRHNLINKEKFVSICNKIEISGEELIKFASQTTI